MQELTIIVIGNHYEIKEDVEVLYASEKDIEEKIHQAKGKYILFMKETDTITNNYYDKVKEKLDKDFDACFINYEVVIDKKRNSKVLTNELELKKKPYYGDYIWSYIFRKEILERHLNIQDIYELNAAIDRDYNVLEAIGEPIYYHDPKQERELKQFIYSDIKKEYYAKNIIYVAAGCDTVFNGYVSWILNIGRCFPQYEITILYDKIYEPTKKIMEKYFKCVKAESGTNYICERLLVTYTSYYYSKNIICLDQSYLFIHGNMSDYENAKRWQDDIYTHYVAVSKISSEKAKGYFPTDNIEYVLNPIKIEKDLIKPHLHLVSTLRYSPEKKPERVEKMAKLMTEMEIPYTWEVFTDSRENTNVDGLIFRQRVNNPIPYIADSDYFVLLSNTESFSYSVLEALCVNTKVVVTPLEVYDEIGVIENENATIIPFEYFEDGQEENLKNVIWKLYQEKDNQISFKVNENMWVGYHEIFT